MASGGGREVPEVQPSDAHSLRPGHSNHGNAVEQSPSNQRLTIHQTRGYRRGRAPVQLLATYW